MPRVALPLLVLALLGAVGCSAGCMVTLSSAFVQSADTPSGLVNSLLLSGAVAGQMPGGYAVNTTQCIYTFFDDADKLGNASYFGESWAYVYVPAGCSISAPPALVANLSVSPYTAQLRFNGWPLYQYIGDVDATTCYGNVIGFVNPPPAPPIAVWSAYTPLGVPYAGVPHFSTPATTTYAPLSLPTSSAGASISIAAATMPSPPAPPPAAPPPPAPPPKVYAPGTCNVSLVATAVDSADYPLGTQTFLQVVNAVPGNTPGGYSESTPQCVYFYIADIAAHSYNATYVGESWAWVEVGQGCVVTAPPAITPLLSVGTAGESYILRLNGYPLYQYIGDPINEKTCWGNVRKCVNANGTAAVIANITLLSVPASFVASVAIENASTTGASSAAAPATAAGWAVSLAAAMASALLLLA